VALDSETGRLASPVNAAWILPKTGLLQFDYASSLRPSKVCLPPTQTLNLNLTLILTLIGQRVHVPALRRSLKS